MLLEPDVKLDFQDVLIVPKRSSFSSRSQVNITREFVSLHAQKKFSCTPIISANMTTVSTFDMACALEKHDWMTALHKFYSLKELVDFGMQYEHLKHTFFTIGATERELNFLKKFKKEIYGKSIGPEDLFFICLDVANGYLKSFAEFVKKVRRTFPESIIMAGNVVTKDMTYQLLDCGADIVKVGIGPGSVCQTRKITGVGYPQLSAIIETADAAHNRGGLICGDGGCVCPGDVVKAFGGGADFVMLGGMLAGHDECNCKIDNCSKFYGMSSSEAMEKHYGGKANYRASEGKCVTIPNRGPVENTINEINGGLRSAMTYLGAPRLKDVPKSTTFIRVNRQLNNMFGG